MKEKNNMIEYDLKALKSFDEVKALCQTVITKNVLYIDDSPTSYMEIFDLLQNYLILINTLKTKGQGITGMNTRAHAVGLKSIANSLNIKCGFVDMLIVNSVSQQTVFGCGINAIPIENQGIVFFAPGMRAFIDEPIKGTSMGEIEVGNVKIIW
jgi:hypothetical protein